MQQERHKNTTAPTFGRALIAMIALLACSGVRADAVSALARIEPKDGVYQLAGPSEMAVVAELLVKEGDRVQSGDVLARLDNYALLSAEARRATVELDYAKKALRRQRDLRQTSVASVAQLEEAERDVAVWQAELNAARERRARAQITAPVDGQILLVNAREGERIGALGLLELGQTDAMYAVAEVYETDISRVAVGQSVTIKSASLSEPLGGKVERVGRLVGKNDALDLDPVARRDARVIEVFVLLEQPERVAGLTNLQVTAIIEIDD
ncbi:MAG: HlyD family efflux transporter periplasmic adaptor subunit [Pseudomonadota bacterium]